MDEREYYLEYLKRTDKFPQSIYHKAKHEMVASLFRGLNDGARVLDAGCGIGHISKPYCGKFDIYGVDEQASAVEYCGKTCKGKYTQATLYKTPFENNFFDLVLLLDTIEHLTDPVSALKEMSRIMKPGAQILICTMNYASPLWFILEHTWHRFAGGKCKPYSKDVHPTPYTKKLLLKHCEGIFNNVKIDMRIMFMELFLTGKKPQ